MKKILSMLLIAGMASFVACGPSAKEKEAKLQHIKDSVKQDSIQKVLAAKEQLKKDSIAKVELAAKEKAKQDSLANLAKKPAGKKVAAHKKKK